MTQAALPEPEAALQTLSMLEARLRRLEFLVTGTSSLSPDEPVLHGEGKSTILTRMLGIEEELRKLEAKSPLVQQILQLHAQHPSLFRPIDATEVPSTLSDENLASIILSCAASFPETASRLTSLKDLPIPPASASEQLVQLQPRLDAALWKQQHQAEQVRELRERCARLLRRWYEVGVVAQGEVWSEWAERTDNIERRIRRVERKKEETYA